MTLYFVSDEADEFFLISFSIYTECQVTSGPCMSYIINMAEFFMSSDHNQRYNDKSQEGIPWHIVAYRNLEIERVY